MAGKTKAQKLLAVAKAKGASKQDLEHLNANTGPVDVRLAATKGIVARGRVVTTEHGTFFPGQEVTCTRDEITRLRRNKYLVDPRENLLPLGTGPKYFQEDKASEGVPEPQ